MQSTTPLTRITIRDDITVCLPESAGLMTPYVLREQKDWFEDEIHFIRRLIRPGMHVIDIGANYGLYTLTMARLIGPKGRLWAFEPAPSTAGYLKESIVSNGFDNIELIQAGLSNTIGEATFFTSNNAEINSLIHNSEHNAATETIKLLTLDHCRERHNWDEIDFIKLDAEGEENNILRASKNTLKMLSPLIMFELKHGDDINTPLIKQFGDMGYNCYRLVPGLNALIPFAQDEPVDAYLLNLFCCKDDRALQLEDRGLLVRNAAAEPGIGPAVDILPLLNYIQGSAYGALLQDQLEEVRTQGMDTYSSVLSNYLLSCESGDMHKRVAHLLYASQQIRPLIDGGDTGFAHLTSFARIAFDVGERALGVRILEHIINQPPEDILQQPTGLCLPACSRYDKIKPVKDINTWLLASVIEQYIIKHSFSTYFSKAEEKCLPLFQRLEEYGYLGEGMARRRQLVQEVFT